MNTTKQWPSVECPMTVAPITATLGAAVPVRHGRGRGPHRAREAPRRVPSNCSAASAPTAPNSREPIDQHTGGSLSESVLEKEKAMTKVKLRNRTVFYGTKDPVYRKLARWLAAPHLLRLKVFLPERL